MKFFIIKLLTLLMLFSAASYANTDSVEASAEISMHKEETYKTQSFSEMISGFITSTGINAIINPNPNEMNAHGEPMSDFHKGMGRVIMILITFLLFYLAIAKGFEPLLLLPIGFGGLFGKHPNSKYGWTRWLFRDYLPYGTL